jgi:signal transduction histidine kinase
LFEYAYEEILPYWNSLFSQNRNLNGPVDILPQNERDFLSAHKVQSILAVPLYLKGDMWGFVSFEDCRKRRFFPEADEYTLRSWGLLVVGAIQRGKIMRDLEDAVGEAKKASAEAMKAYAEAETASVEAINASSAKSRFIANMNHEMRTPMNAIVALTNLML